MNPTEVEREGKLGQTCPNGRGQGEEIWTLSSGDMDIVVGNLHQE